MNDIEERLRQFMDPLVRLMGSDVQALILIGIVLFLVFGAVAALLKPGRKTPSRRRRWKSGSARRGPFKVVPSNKAAPVDMSDPKNQLEAVSHVNFERVPLLNKEEHRLLPLLEKLVRHASQGHRVMAQTSLGEVIRPASGDKARWARANASVNSKRLDFAIFNKFGLLVAAVEYQGSGHYHQTSFMRDAVKKEALRRAGVPLIEVDKTFDPEVLKRQILPLLSADDAPKQTSADPVTG